MTIEQSSPEKIDVEPKTASFLWQSLMSEGSDCQFGDLIEVSLANQYVKPLKSKVSIYDNVVALEFTISAREGGDFFKSLSRKPFTIHAKFSDGYILSSEHSWIVRHTCD